MAKMIISKQIRRLLKPTEMSPGDMYLVVLMMLVEARKSRTICGPSISPSPVIGIYRDFHNRGRGDETDHLPERKENNKFDTQQLEKRLIRRQRILQTQIKRNKAVHCDRDSASIYYRSPYVRVLRAKRFFAVDTLDLGHCCDDGAGDPDKHILEYTDPDDVEPGQAALGRGQFASWPGPWLDLEGREEVFLVAEGRGDVAAQQREEGRNREGFIAVLDEVCELHSNNSATREGSVTRATSQYIACQYQT